MTTKKSGSPRAAAPKKSARRVLRGSGKTGKFTREQLREAVLAVVAKRTSS